MKVTIEELEQSDSGVLEFNFEDSPEGIDLAEPAHAEFTVSRIGGGFISVVGHVSAKLNAVCDNCLKNFIYDIDTDVNETYAENTLYEENKGETEIKDNFFAIDLNGADEIDLTDLMYQSLILAIPNKLVCDINCMGSEEIKKYLKKEIQDPRLEVFKTIKTEKEN